MRFLLFLGFVGLAWAQDPLVVEGTVVNALSGSPLRRVSVQLVGAGEPMVTDATGRFRFVGVKPGRYLVQAVRQGYFTDAGLAPTVEMTAGRGVTVAPVKLWPGGSISGAVSDEAGEPVVGVQVTLMRRAYLNGRREMVQVIQAQTDDRGQYRLFGLKDDRYFLRAEAPRVPGEAVQYPSTFYPSMTEPDKATPVALAPGQEQSGFNIALRPVKGFRLAGRVMNGLTNTPLDDLSVSIFSRGGPTISTPVQHGSGRFAINGVPPGLYDFVSITVYDRRKIQARILLDVRRDVDDLVATLLPGVQLRGRMRVDGDGEMKWSGMGVAIESAEDVIGGGGMGRVDAEGKFEIGPLAAGRYTPKLHGLPAGAYLKAVKIGEQEATLDLSGASGQTVETTWVVSLAGGKVRGKTAAGVVVALVPAADQPLRQSRYKAVEADSEGRYEVTGVAPGSYQVYAFAQAEAGAWMDDAFLATLADGGVAVKVEERETKAVDVKAQ